MSFLFSKQSKPGPVTVATKFITAVEPGQEMCEICDRIDIRERMHPAGDGVDGCAVYVCDAAHPARGESG